MNVLIHSTALVMHTNIILASCPQPFVFCSVLYLSGERAARDHCG